MSDTESNERATVLVVDDETETADLYTEFLSEDYRVRTAYSGEAALDIVDSEVAVVLLDRRMPGLSGDEVLKTPRARDLGCRVVMVTAVGPDLDVLDLPFDDYLVKPASREMIHDTVTTMLLRNTCDEAMQEVVALASKMATLESKMALSELEASSEYTALEARLTELSERTDMGEETDDLYTEFTVEKIEALFSGLKSCPAGR